MDRRWLLAAGVAVVSVLAGIWWGRGVTPPTAASPSTAPGVTLAAPPSTATTAMAHVSGWVVSPGLVSVREGARVADAVAAAGGVRPGARLDALNLAQTVVDGQQIVVPGPNDAAGASDPGSSVTTGDGLIHLNTATAAELETLPGVGPVLAQRIADHRDANGGFQQVEDLLDVSGIGESKLDSIRGLVSVP